jgi:hypothetical protein
MVGKTRMGIFPFPRDPLLAATSTACDDNSARATNNVESRPTRASKNFERTVRPKVDLAARSTSTEIADFGVTMWE